MSKKLTISNSNKRKKYLQKQHHAGEPPSLAYAREPTLKGTPPFARFGSPCQSSFFLREKTMFPHSPSKKPTGLKRIRRSNRTNQKNGETKTFHEYDFRTKKSPSKDQKWCLSEAISFNLRVGTLSIRKPLSPFLEIFNIIVSPIKSPRLLTQNKHLNTR
jgi:hypothetical protein